MKRELVRDKFIHVKCSEGERLAFQAKAKAAGVSVADLIRLSVDQLSVRPIPDRNREHKKQMTRKVAQVENNLNQLARWANTYKSDAEIQVVIRSLKLIEDSIREIRDVD